MKQKLCAIGEALIDFIPQEKGKRLCEVENFKRVAGGAPANVAGAVAKLGLSAKFITKLGQDAFGDYIVQCLASCGIDTSYIKRTKEADTALAFVSLAADGNRDFLFYRRRCADQLLEPSEVAADVLDDCGILHFCSVALVESPMKYAHQTLIDQAIEKDVLISFDPNLRLSLWENEEDLFHTVVEFLPSADILKISDEEITFITGCDTIEEALPSLFVGRVKAVLYTMGKDGASLYLKDGRHITCEGNVIDVVDTTGAGDSFIGAFLYKMLFHETSDLTKLSDSVLAEYLSFANAYAACTTSRAGALDAMANAQEFENFRKTL